ncbi:MAG TPA: hypothetical protein VHH88_00890 [Verrucomicrobiae bacterium]|nr:hypothetical protein [Verrucomicrobiae bacterium]
MFLRSRHKVSKILLLGGGVMALVCCGSGTNGSNAGPASPVRNSQAAPARKAPVSAREMFNAGTERLHAGNLAEAEGYFQSALLTQKQQYQPEALYNLGYTRFQQGAEELKKHPSGQAVGTAGGIANEHGRSAVQMADDALAGDDVQKLVAAYLHGRGTRKELKAATEAVKEALRQHAVTLGKWQRASGDFKSDLEMNPADAAARENAEIVDRNIAKLVDLMQQLKQMAQKLGDQKEKLGLKLKQLKGRIPEKDMPPGAAGDDDDDDFPFGKEPKQKEGPSKEGHEMNMSEEQAGWLLQSYRLDSERKLPMGQSGEGKPVERNGRTW